MNPSSNPLFPHDSNQSNQAGQDGFTLPQNNRRIEPLGEQASEQAPGAKTAADLIREKLAKIYAEEPDATTEAHEAEVVRPRSKHQDFMHRLSTSGMSLAEIQTEWHNYYVALPDNEKHQVWQEFYDNNSRAQNQASSPSAPAQDLRSVSPQAPATIHSQSLPVAEKSGIVVADHVPKPERTVKKPARRKLRAPDLRSPEQIKQSIRHHVSAGGQLTGKHHLQSLLFGIGTGLIVVFIFLFGFFNEVVLAPFIQPSRTSAATPIIVDPGSITAGSTPQVIIPKINVQIPVDYSQTTTNETDIENGLENGIVHYPTTKRPGEVGNAAFFGHSSNNIFNKGKYKFAFVLLHELVPGDTFYITYNGTAYVYKVTSKTIVKPTEVGVLNDIPGKSTATLITCDPPGTSLNRLVVVGEQISPDPTGNAAGAAAPATTSTTTHQLPGNGPTLWTRMWRAIF